MSEDAKFTVYGSQIQKWTDDIQMLVKQRDQYKEENEQLREENEKLKTQKIAFQRSYKQVYEENKDLKHENKALRLQSDTYFEQWQNEKLK